MLAVIADDITGAAEIAGIGFRSGFRTALITELGDSLPDCQIVVWATDTRSMTEKEAVAETRRVVRQLWKACVREFFKKTDSALRGHVVPELLALLEELPYTRALYLPENPSKGRIIKDGIYYIGGIPLHQTSFAFDPEFPATTSVVTERVPGVRRLTDFRSLSSPVLETDTLPQCMPEAERTPGLQSSVSEQSGTPLGDNFQGNTPLYVADAETEEEIASLLYSLDVRTILPAGAADLFAAYLSMKKLELPSQNVHLPLPFAGLQSGKALIVCGSTQSASLADTAYVKEQAIPLAQMPLEVFEGTAPVGQWLEQLSPLYQQTRSAVLTIGYPPKGGKEFALRLRHTLAEVVATLVAEACPDELVIEGGATAFAILQSLGWKHFDLTDEIAPGVVRMQREERPGVFVTLKPGSYSWGAFFK